MKVAISILALALGLGLVAAPATSQEMLQEVVVTADSVRTVSEASATTEVADIIEALVPSDSVYSSGLWFATQLKKLVSRLAEEEKELEMQSYELEADRTNLRNRSREISHRAGQISRQYNASVAFLVMGLMGFAGGLAFWINGRQPTPTEGAPKPAAAPPQKPQAKAAASTRPISKAAGKADAKDEPSAKPSTRRAKPKEAPETKSVKTAAPPSAKNEAETKPAATSSGRDDEKPNKPVTT